MILKAKRRKRHLKFRAPQPVERTPLASEPRSTVTYLGTVTIPEGQAVAFDIPPGASPDEIKAALVAVEERNTLERERESRRIAALFPLEDAP
jgi:hypothetical protein